MIPFAAEPIDLLRRIVGVGPWYGLGPLEGHSVITLGRTVGWLAHALEQQDSGRLIRPRARYIGPI